MLSYRPKGGISHSANDRDVSTSHRFARPDRTTFILSTYLLEPFTSMLTLVLSPGSAFGIVKIAELLAEIEAVA